MKLPFWRRTVDIEPLIDVRVTSGRLPLRGVPFDTSLEIALDEWRAANPPLHDDPQAKLAEVTVERDELLQALDEQRPAPDAAELGEQLKAAWYFTSAVERSYNERWTAVAETAIDAVRGLWPTEPIAAEIVELDEQDVAALDAEADRRLPVCGRIQPARTGYHAYQCSNDLGHDGDHCAEVDGRVVATWTYCCDTFPFCACPTKTSPGAPGQRPDSTADRDRGLGSDTAAPGDTVLPVPAVLSPAGTGGITPDEERELQDLIASDTELAAGAARGRALRAAAVDEHIERLALRLAVTAGTVTSLTWNLMTDSYREVYRGLAAQVALAGWLPPGTRRASGNVPAIAEVLTGHELLADGTCRCDFGREWDPAAARQFELWHAEHVAQELLAAAVLA